jgi:hypothetical protein
LAGALTKSLRHDAVRMLELGVRTAEQLAGELGVSSWSLKRWAKVYGQDSVADGPPGSDGPSRWKMRVCGVSKMKSLPNKSRLFFCKVVGPMVLGASNKCFGVEASIVARIGSVGSWTGLDLNFGTKSAMYSLPR